MAHTERFTGRVADYVRYRTRYPAQVLDHLAQYCGLLPDQLIADVGAGTGMLAELFLSHGNPVVAVEPNAEMRAACVELEAAWPKLRVLDGTAEATGIADAFVDMISAGRAFHWFEPVATRQEFRRILRPGGWVVLVASGRLRDQTPQSIAYEAILREHGTDYEVHRTRYDIEDALATFFAGGRRLHFEIPTLSQLTLEALLGQTQSLSVTPQPGQPGYEGMQAALRAHFDRWAQQGILIVPNICYVNCGQF